MSIRLAGAHLSAGAVSLLLFTGGAGCTRPPISETCLELETPVGPVGFDAPVSIRAALRCDAGRGRVSWSQVGGPPLRELTVFSDGRGLSARTPPLSVLWSDTGRPIPWGIVPFSPRTRGAVRLKATWRGDDGRSVARELELAATDRARGLPNTPVSARILLSGDRWRLDVQPPGSRAVLGRDGELASLTPDVPGDWRLSDGSGRTLALRSGRYADTPLDCGRSDCHQAISEAASSSPMTTVLARGLALASAAGHGAHPGCALACHAIGDPGLDDGGFVEVARAIDFTRDLANARWETLPRPLRRVGGVGCLACHGPGAVPEAAARWAVLRADVCATCHDAPPRYGHVAAWLGSAMARADTDARAANDETCAGCHTTWGFLATQAGVEVAPARHRKPPPETGPNGIACAACHAVHDPDHGRARGAAALLRSPHVPSLLAEVASGAGPAVCLPCHTPDPKAPRPFATAAAIWLGRGGIDPATGDPLDGFAPHRKIAGGCTGCHRETAVAGLDRGRSHGFAAPADVCRPCHGNSGVDLDLQTAARRLWSRLERADLPSAGAPAPGHAEGRRLDRSTPRGRAAWNVLLVLEDRGASAHNPSYARRLLATAQDLLDALPRPGDRP